MSTFGPSPREAPLTYPGTPPEASGLVTPDAFLPFEPLGPRRLTQARLLVDEDGPPALVDLAPTHVTLGYALLALNAVPMDVRVPVLAVGSNASPAQLRTKFREAGTSCVMPLTWAAVTGVRVGVAAMVSRWGYVPAGPVFDPDATSRLAVTWLDADQLRAVDETETGYQRRLVRTASGSAAGPGSARVRLESGEVLDDCGVYVSLPGLIAAPDTDRPLDLPSQPELIEHLLARADPELRDLVGGTVVGFVAAAADDDVRTRMSEVIVRSAQVPVVHPVEPTSTDPGEPYGASRQGLPVPPDTPDALRVAPSPDGIDRRGEPTVVVCPDRWDGLGRPTHVVVRSCMDASSPAAVGRAVVEECGSHEILIDQAIRNGIGVEVGEYVTLDGAAVERHPVADALLSTPHSLLCRVQQAELVTAERRAAMLERLALDLVGVEVGDRVVIEGLPDRTGGDLRTVTVRAYEVSDDILERRERLSAGGFAHRFPSARDAIGVHPDLPWIFIDRALRTELGLTQPQLAVVRVRASRKDQLTKELREMLLVIVVAFIGLIAAFDTGWTWIAALTAAAAVVLGIVGLRLRSRLRSV